MGFIVGLFTAIPLFQTSLLPCFTQVYLMFPTIFVVPDLVHLVPEIAPLAGLIGNKNNERVIAIDLKTLRTKQNIPFCNFI